MRRVYFFLTQFVTVQKRYFPISNFLFILVSLTPSLIAEAQQDMASCRVPVCDRVATVESLRGMSQRERYRLLVGFRERVNQLTDFDSLENLRLFSHAATERLIELSEANWMIETSRAIESASLLRLSRYAPLDANTIMEYFRALPQEGNRNEVILFWRGRIPDYEDEHSLLELGQFFSQAERLCRELDDDDYVFGAARTGAQLVNQKLTRLHPFFEGSFEVEGACAQAGACPLGLIDRIVILDSLGLEGIQVSAVSSRMGSVLYHFTSVEATQGATHFEGISRVSSNGVARIQFELDRTTRTIRGTLENADFTIPFVARSSLENAPITFFESASSFLRTRPLSPQIFNQTLEGHWGEEPARLRIVVFDEEHVAGTLLLDRVNNLVIRLNSGRFFPRSGIVVLAGATPGGALLKMTLSVQSSEPLRFHGVAISALNGHLTPVNWTARVSVEQP